MRNVFTGVGTALITPFTKSGALDEAGGPASWRSARSMRAFISWCRAARPAKRRRSRRPSAGASSRSASRRRAGARWCWPARAATTRAKSSTRPSEMQKAGAQRPAVRDAVLQPADARRPLSSTTRRSPTARRCRSSCTTCPAAPAATSIPPRCVGSSSIPNIVGVKEASGNVTQMAEICRSVPEDFLVLSGDDALTLPLMAIGGRGIISVASNEVPAEMVQMVEAAERGDFAAARHWHEKLLPIMQINFVESSPGPVKFAMAAMGLCEEIVPAADGAAAPGVAGKGARRCSRNSACRSSPGRTRESGGDASRSLFAQGAQADKAAAREAFVAVAHAARRRRSARRRAGLGDAVRLARQRLGEAGHSARLPVRRHRRRVRRSRPLAVLRQGHDAAEEARRRRRRPHRARRIDDSRRRVRRSQRRLHAADVREHRRVRRRGIAGRFARARRIVRADRQARALSAPPRRSAASSSPSARCR